MNCVILISKNDESVGLKMHTGGIFNPQTIRTEGKLGYRNWIFGEDGEVMIKKESVAMAGIRVALAFNAGRFDVIVRELTSCFDISGAIRRQMGDIISFQPAIPPVGMAAGGVDNNYDLTVNVNGGEPYRDLRALAEIVLGELKDMRQRMS